MNGLRARFVKVSFWDTTFFERVPEQDSGSSTLINNTPIIPHEVYKQIVCFMFPFLLRVAVNFSPPLHESIITIKMDMVSDLPIPPMPLIPFITI